MARLTRTQRRIVIEQLTAWIEEVVGDESNDVDFAVENGMHLALAADLETTRPIPNGSATLVVRVNGGARQTRGVGDEIQEDAA